MSNAEAHQIARERGVSPALYLLARLVLTPLFRVWLRLRSRGAEDVPREGPVILAPNHKSEWDPFLVASCIRRRMRFMAKAELFDSPLARPLLRLGAFPVRRGSSDMEAIATARQVLEAGGVLLLFPEGKLVLHPYELGMPRRGVGRLALETGAPIVPVAIGCSDGLQWGPFLKPRRVRIRFGEPIMVERMTADPETAGRLVEELLWPQVRSEFEAIRGSRAA